MTSSTKPQGWEIVAPLAADGSSRRYSRVAKGGHSAILMQCDDTTPGHKISDFVRIAQWLDSKGINVPEIYEQGDGYLLVEDFGDISFKKAVASKDISQLIDIAQKIIGIFSHETILPELPDYYKSHVHAHHRFVVDWYMQAAGKAENPDALAAEYLAVWQEIEKTVPAQPAGFMHMDFHFENLMWLPGEQSTNRCGVLDFQGAMRGPPAYDLGNLLEDARTDVPDDIRQKVLSAYDEEFQAAYRVLTTQFHCRVIGQFIKMAKQDGETQYLAHIPRLQNYIREALKNPVLKPLQQWFADHKVTFTEKP